MATSGDNAHDQDSDRRDAREALAGADSVAREVRFPPVPYWFVVLNAVLFAALVLGQLADDDRFLFMGGAMVAIVTLNLAASRRAGVVGASSAPPSFAAVMMACLAVIVASFIWYESSGEEWTVYACAGVVGCLIAVSGIAYRRARNGQ